VIRCAYPDGAANTAVKVNKSTNYTNNELKLVSSCRLGLPSGFLPFPFLFIFAPWEFPVHLEPINKLLTTESDRFF
jgi:hypothetical protein